MSHDHGTEISATCEVVLQWSGQPFLGTPLKVCGLSTVAGYPAMRGGWMALCAIHVSPHESYAVPVEDIRSGIALAMLENGSRG